MQCTLCLETDGSACSPFRAGRKHSSESLSPTLVICSLIAFGVASPARADHILWMIQNHPEWDGFSLEPFRGVAEPRRSEKRDMGDYIRLKDAWLRQAGLEQK